MYMSWEFNLTVCFLNLKVVLFIFFFSWSLTMCLLMTSWRAAEFKGTWPCSFRELSTPAIQSSISSRPSCTLSERVRVIWSFSFRSFTHLDRSSYLPTMSSSPKRSGNVIHLKSHLCPIPCQNYTKVKSQNVHLKIGKRKKVSMINS